MEIMDDSELDLLGQPNELMVTELPSEIVAKICSYLSIRVLQSTVSKICRKWKGVACYIIEQRRLFMVKRSANEKDELTIQCSTSQTTSPMELLAQYESSHNVGTILMVHRIMTQQRLDLYDLGQVRQGLRIENCVSKEFKFIPMYNLLCLWKFMKMHFVHESNFSGEGNLPVPPYVVENINAVLLGCDCERDMLILDVYGDKLLLRQRHTCGVRFPVFCEIENVNHTTRAIRLKLIRHIHFPLTSLSTIIWKDRVITVLATGFVCIWRQTNDGSAEHLISNVRIYKNAVEADELELFRVGNLIIIRTHSDKVKIVDAADDKQDFDICEFPLLSVLSALVPCTIVYPMAFPYEFTQTVEIVDIQLTGNILMILASVELPLSDGDNEKLQIQRLLFTLKLKRFPTLDDFATVDNFKDLVIVEDSNVFESKGDSLVLVPPSALPRGKDEAQLNVKATFFDTIEFERVRARSCVRQCFPAEYKSVASIRLFHIIDSSDLTFQDIPNGWSKLESRRFL